METNAVLRWEHPWAALVAGSSGAGKTTFIKRFLRHLEAMSDTKFCEIILFYSEWQPVYNELAELRKIDFREGLPRGDDFPENAGPKLVIMDDLMAETDKNVVNIFTRASHHRNLSVFFLTQNLFHRGQREISLNSNYIVVFKNPRDRAQIAHFARQIWPENARFVQDAYADISGKAHGYLLFDLKQNTPENCRLRTDIFPDDRYTVVYVPSSGRKSIKASSTCNNLPVWRL